MAAGRTSRGRVSPFPPGAPRTQLVPELLPTHREAVIDKIIMSAFEGTWLDIALHDCGITTAAVSSASSPWRSVSSHRPACGRPGTRPGRRHGRLRSRRRGGR
ncbi:isochorismatase family protein [Streptomyces sp. NPDC002133]|uniref:isochorismatase family protein n=1 Tax=Streptomyces sp. NPDC002133 TaxID=3154409 RepID=UPI0033195B52